ncbi:MAG: twin-arginine translocase subunit TatC [Desulfobacterota bacterium]|nr:twin-arginine translocase subunit TatC [Thermodesulfobacteriota bacterium]
MGDMTEDKKEEERGMDENGKMPFTEHLAELRKRLIICFAGIGVGFAIAYFFKESLFVLLMQPLKGAMNPGQKLIFTGLPEAFFVYIEVAFFGGILFAAPLILFQMWLFIAPGLYKNEQRFLLPLLVLSIFFFAGGVVFGYSVVFPYAFKYLLGFESDLVQALPSMREYLTLATTLLIAFGFIFQLPLVMTMLARFGIVTPRFLSKNRKYAVLLSFVAAAIITPTPDVVNQFLMAGPLVILYEVSIVGAKIFGKKQAQQKDEETEKPDARHAQEN